MNIWHSNNKIVRKVRKFLVTHDASIVIGETAEGYYAVMLNTGQVTFIDPNTGELIKN